VFLSHLISVSFSIAEQVWATELDFVVINRRNLMAMSVVGPTPPYQKHQHQERQPQHPPNVTVNSLEPDEEDYNYNDTMFTAIRGSSSGSGINNNLFQLTRDKDGTNGRKAAKTTVTTTKTTTTNGAATAGAMGKTRYFEVPDLINRDIDEDEEQDERERQELEEAAIDDIDDANDDDDATDNDDDDDDGVAAIGRDEGTIIMPDFDASNEFVPKATATATQTATTISKLGAENWQKLGTLDKTASKITTTIATSSSSTTTTKATTTTTTKATTSSTTATTTTTASPSTATTPIGIKQQSQHHQHHNKSTRWLGKDGHIDGFVDAKKELQHAGKAIETYKLRTVAVAAGRTCCCWSDRW